MVQRLTGDAALNRQLAKTTLTEGQQEAVALGLSSGKGRYVAIQGYAGTGKTFAMERLAHYAEKHGYQIDGYAPSHVAVEVLKEPISQTTTLAMLTTRERTHPVERDKSKTIMVINESSMVSSRDMRTLMDHAERTGVARVVLLGDLKQLDAVNAGTPFEQLQKAGIPTAVMNDIQRQRNPDLLDAVNHAIKGEAHAALLKIGDNVWVSEDYRSDAAAAWLALSDKERDRTRLITLTNDTRTKMNETIRDALKSEGKISGQGITAEALTPLQLTRAEAADVASYKTGDVVHALRSIKTAGITRGETYRVDGIDQTSSEIILRAESGGDPLRVHLSPHNRAGSSLLAYEPETRELAAGDAIRFKITDKEAGIMNGQTGRISGITPNSVTVQRDAGNSVELELHTLVARGIQHNYAATTHADQGATVDRVIAAMGPDEALTSQKSFYVQISRARDEALLFTSDSDKLAARIEKTTGVRPDALGLWKEQMSDELSKKAEESRRQAKDDKSAPEDPAQEPEKEARSEPCESRKDAAEIEPARERKDPFEHAAELVDAHRDRQKDMTR
nr:AAA family ATPase [Palleronia caenipelagi]